ncbi:replication initiation and membrane attachment family protein [Gracilibacillus marinus]|uniref:Replication initiation and membrane attachment family protein n=1 Tax=Gracilibacillus marinus TaxID=630535 RepID=A0ABV8VUR5_9BACI
MSIGDLGKILPAERYIVELSSDVQQSYNHVLTHLYQPLIGIDAISLYQTLLSESTLLFENKNYQTHHMLMNYIGLPLDRIYRARRKLEGIGLLKTFEIEHQAERIFRYVIQSPLSSSAFFQHDTLSQLLLHQIGKEKFAKIEQAFSKQVRQYPENMYETTAKFKEVFYLKNLADVDNIHEDKSNTSEIFVGTTIDFGWIAQLLDQRMLPKHMILSDENKKLIQQMQGLYNLTNQEVEKALIWAIGENHQLNKKEFKEACFDFSASSSSKVTLQVIEHRDKLATNERNQAPKTQEEQFISMLEQISPKELLEDLTDGAKASNQDLKTISEVMTQQGLTPGVMNVLIHYVMLKTDMKLTKSYLEKIASHWARKNVKTVRQAMTLAKSENKKYQQWTKSTKQNRQSYVNTKRDIVPEWYKKQKEERKQNETTDKEVDKQKRAEEADALLAEYLQQQTKDE